MSFDDDYYDDTMAPVAAPKPYEDIKAFVDVVNWWDWRCEDAARAIFGSLDAELVSARFSHGRNGESQVTVEARPSTYDATRSRFNYSYADFFSENNLWDVVVTKRLADENEKRRLLKEKQVKIEKKEADAVQTAKEKSLHFLQGLIERYPTEAEAILKNSRGPIDGE